MYRLRCRRGLCVATGGVVFGLDWWVELSGGVYLDWGLLQAQRAVRVLEQGDGEPYGVVVEVCESPVGVVPEPGSGGVHAVTKKIETISIICFINYILKDFIINTVL